MRLDLDVIFLIMGYVDEWRDLSSVTKTCRACRSIGMPVLLRRPVRIRGRKQLRSFRDFMLSNLHGSPNCFQYLHSLFVSTKINDSSKAALLFEVLVHAVNLRHLELTHAKPLLESDSNDHHWSMIELPNLVRADFLSAGTRVVDWLKSRSFPISELNITARSANESIDLIRAISNLGATLTRMEAILVDIEPTEMQFPHLHTLNLYTSGITPAASVFRTFPNLRHLYIGRTDINPDDDVTWQDYTINRAKSDRIGQPLPTLKLLKGEPMELFRGAFLCPVETLEFTEVSINNLPYVLPLLQETRPSFLEVLFYVDMVQDITFVLIYSVLEAASIMTTLNELWLDLEFIEPPTDITKQLVRRLSDVFGLVPLQSLSILLNCDVSMDEDPVEDLDFFEGFFDLEELVTQTALQTPTLRFIGIYSRFDRKIWTVNDDRSVTRNGPLPEKWVFGSGVFGDKWEGYDG